MFRVTSVADLAGQVTAKSTNADRVTVGTIYLPSGALKAIRRRIPADLPKWRNATNHDVRYVVELVLREGLAAGVGSIDKTTDEWRTFWEDAQAVHSKVASLEGGSIGYLKAATLLKFILFGSASSAGLGNAIRIGRIVRSRAQRGVLRIAEDIILDNEIQGDDNRDALVTIWRSVNEHQPLVNSLGVFREARTLTLATEQSEPLLLLADYMAGLVHARRSQADVLAQSQVSRPIAEAALDRLIRSGRVEDFTGSVQLRYFDIYPEFQQFAGRGGAA